MAAQTEYPHAATSRGTTGNGIQTALLCCLAVLAALYFAWPIWRAQWIIEIDGNEAWNAFHVDRLRSGLPLYPARDDLISNNYPPLSFMLIRWLSESGASPILIGRILSLLATAAVAVSVGSVIRCFGGAWAGALLGSLWYLATMARFFDTYVGMNDPNLAALAVMMGGLAWSVHAQKHGRAVEPAFVLMAIAGFYKHNLVAIPLAAFVWLLTLDGRTALRAALAGGITAVVGLLACTAVFGHAFVDQMTLPRVIDLQRPFNGSGRLQWILPALAIWVYWASTSRQRAQVRFTAILVLFAFGDHCFQQIGVGVDDNSQLQLVAAVGIGLGLAYHYVEPPRLLRRGRIIVLAIVLLRLLLNNRYEPYLLVSSAAFRSIGPASVAVATSEARRVAAIPGEVSCSVMTVCYEAGKKFVFYPFSVMQRRALGTLSESDFRLRTSAEQITFETIDPRASMRPFRQAGGAP